VTDTLASIIDLGVCPLGDGNYVSCCAADLERDGVITLPGFLQADVIDALVAEAETHKDKAYFTALTHNVYLTLPDRDLGNDHIFNRQVSSSKGCITTDQVPAGSPLHALYQSEPFKAFIATIVGVEALYECGDPLSGINVHYAAAGQELGWHFDNSKFAITLLLQKPQAGGAFQYVRDLRDADVGEMNFGGVEAVLDGDQAVSELVIEPGTLVLFRGRNSLHRVTPTEGDVTRILVVLAYNANAGVALSESARMTFFGRLG
jgi:hypothetical protein